MNDDDDTPGTPEQVAAVLAAHGDDYPELFTAVEQEDGSFVDVLTPQKRTESTDQHRAEGEVWQGASGKWFTKKQGRTVPAKAPGGDKGGSKLPKRGGVEIAPEDERGHNVTLPKDPKRLNIDQANAALAQMGYKKTGSRFDSKTKTSYVTLRLPSGEEKEVTADDVKKLLYGRAPKQTDTQPAAPPSVVAATDTATEPGGFAAVKQLNDSISDPRVKDYIDSAIWNATDSDGEEDEQRLASSLAFSFKIAFEKQDTESLAAIKRALYHVNARTVGEPGEAIKFKGVLYTSQDPLFTDDSAIVVQPAVVQTIANGEKVWLKGIAKKG